MAAYPQLAPEQLERFLNLLDRYKRREASNNRRGALGKLFDHAVAADGRLSSPLVVIIDLTNKCNQNCIFCYREGRKGLGGSEEDWHFRSLDELETIFDDLKAMNVASVALTGGEATCHPRFLDATLHAALKTRPSADGSAFSCTAGLVGCAVDVRGRIAACAYLNDAGFSRETWEPGMFAHLWKRLGNAWAGSKAPCPIYRN